MHVRSIEHDELAAFARLSGDGEFAAQVASMWESGSSSPMLCFVGEEDGRAVARVGYQRSADREFSLFGLWLPWGRHVDAARTLLPASLTQVRAAGVDVVEAWINPSFHSFAREREEALVAGGFECVQSKVRLVGPTGGAEAPRLDLRTRADTGGEGFVDAVAAINESTLDRLDALERARLGARRHAELYVGFLEDEGTKPDWWLLAYDGDQVIGTVVLHEWDEDTGTLAFVGVVPEARGRGLVHALLAEARQRLAAAGYARILADVDDRNAPMVRALERAGMEPDAQLRVYWARLGG